MPPFFCKLGVVYSKMATRGQTAGKQKVIVLVDMDCFYVQVEKKLHPELVGKPCAVVQYKKWQGGG